MLMSAETVAALDAQIDNQPVTLAGRALEVPDQCQRLDTRTIRCPASELAIAPVGEPNRIAAEASLHSEQLAQFEANCRTGYDAWERVCSVDGVATNCYVASCREQGHAQVAAMAEVRDEVVAVSCRFNPEGGRQMPPLCAQVIEPDDVVIPPVEP